MLLRRRKLTHTSELFLKMAWHTYPSGYNADSSNNSACTAVVIALEDL
jgi:hypothetical protein